jgi:hypothetical protein
MSSRKLQKQALGPASLTRDLTSDQFILHNRMNPAVRTKLNHNVDSLSHNHYLFPLSKSELPVSAGAAQKNTRTIEIEIDECVEAVDFH